MTDKAVKSIDSFSDDDKVVALKRIPILSDLTERELGGLLSVTELAWFEKGEVIFCEGTYGDEVYLILRGMVKVTTTEPQRKTKILSLLREGDVLGEMAIIDAEYRCATATAHEDSETLMLNSRDFMNFISSNMPMTLKVMKTLCRRLRDANDEIRNFTFYDLAGRLAKVILSLYEKFPGDENGVAYIDLELTHQDLANMLGTARESVTKLISTFKRNGGIEYRDHHIFIVDEDELASWVR